MQTGMTSLQVVEASWIAVRMPLTVRWTADRRASCCMEDLSGLGANRCRSMRGNESTSLWTGHSSTLFPPPPAGVDLLGALLVLLHAGSPAECAPGESNEGREQSMLGGRGSRQGAGTDPLFGQRDCALARPMD